jgi:hypothetical protein
MTGLFLISWALAPVTMLIVVTALGLLVRRLSGGALAGVLVLPIGFAAVLVSAALTTQLSATAPLTGAALGVLAVAGLVLERRTWWPPGSQRLAWPAAAAIAAFLAFAVPTVLAGSVGFTGYTRIVDIAHQLDFAAYLGDKGHTPIELARSSYEHIVKGLLNSGYPGGWQAALAGFGQLLRTDPLWLYQPLLAVTGGVGALVLYALLANAIPSAPVRAGAAAVAIQPNVLYAAGLVGGFKEIAAAWLLAVVAVLVRAHRFEPARWREQIPLATALGGLLAAFNVAAIPWLGVMLVGFLALALWERRRDLRTWRPGRPTSTRAALGWVAAAAVLLALSLPAAVAAVKLSDVAFGADSGSASGRTAVSDKGNLLTAMPVRAAGGVWITDDYRNGSRGTTAAKDVFVWIGVGLALLGLAASIRRRDWSLAVLGIASAVALTYYANRTGPWIELKAIGITGSIALACAFAGAAALARSGRRFLVAAGWLVGAVVALSVLAGNALAYHNGWIAPESRLRELEQIGKDYDGRGPALFPDFDEIAEYLLRRQDASVAVSPAPGAIPRLSRDPRTGGILKRTQFTFGSDIDNLDVAHIQSRPLLILRRSPKGSRPPSNWQLVERRRYYEVWERNRPASSVRLHVPFQGRPGETSATTCDRVVDQVRAAAKGKSARLAYTMRPVEAELRVGQTAHPDIWTLGRRRGTALYLNGAGSAVGRLNVPRAGSYRAWLGGSFGREFRVEIDGRRIGELELDFNYPDHFEPVGAIRLGAGSHHVRLSRGGITLKPGNGDSGDQYAGPLVLLPAGREHPPIRTAPIGDAARLCRAGGLDWLEVVRR